MPIGISPVACDRAVVTKVIIPDPFAHLDLASELRAGDSTGIAVVHIRPTIHCYLRPAARRPASPRPAP